MSEESDAALERMNKREALRLTPAGLAIVDEYEAECDAARARMTLATAQGHIELHEVLDKYHPLLHEAWAKWDKYSTPFMRQMEKEDREAEGEYRNAMGKLEEVQGE